MARRKVKIGNGVYIVYDYVKIRPDRISGVVKILDRCYAPYGLAATIGLNSVTVIIRMNARPIAQDAWEATVMHGLNTLQTYDEEIVLDILYAAAHDDVEQLIDYVQPEWAEPKSDGSKKTVYI